MIDWLIKTVAENLTLSVIVVSLILNIFYDLLKKLVFTGVKLTAAKSNQWAINKVEYLVKHYQEEALTLQKVGDKDGEELMKILESVFNSIILGFGITILFVILNQFGDKLMFYTTLGVFWTLILKVVRNLFYYFRIIQKAKNLNYHLAKIEDRISSIGEMIKLRKKN